MLSVPLVAILCICAKPINSLCSVLQVSGVLGGGLAYYTLTW